MTEPMAMPELIMGWQGPITVLDVWAGELDRRMWHEAEWPDLPRTMGSSHFENEAVGTVDEIAILTADDGTRYVWGRGRFSHTDAGRKAAQQVAEGTLRTVSIEISDGEFTDWPIFDPDDEEMIIGFATEWDRIVIGAFALERQPAFAGCVIVPDADAAAFVYEPPAAPNPGDGTVADDGERPDSEPMESEEMFSEVDAITASMTDAPPAEWFGDPGLDGPTPLTLSDDGRLYGHIATFGECHTSFPDACVCAPRSEHDYAYFMTGCVRCADGETMAVGTLTAAGEHAPITADAQRATAHYDNTCAGVADIAVGEDDHGIWCSGRIRPGVSERQVDVLLASSPSGDWRPVGGSLELVAVLAVNVPGFPVPRARVASGERMALVASGGAPALAALARRQRGVSGRARVVRDDPRVDQVLARVARLEKLLDPTLRDAAREGLAAANGNRG